MENGIWKNKCCLAAEIAVEYSREKEIRIASAHNELRCLDPECQNPVLRYCHGEKKDAYFAHQNNMNCDYAEFDKGNNKITRNVRKCLYEQCKRLGYQVWQEVKLLKHHYTHLLLVCNDDSEVAVEIGFHQMSASKIDALMSEYSSRRIHVTWVVIDNTDVHVNEKHTYFLKRFLLNEADKRDLLVISYDGMNLSQYKTDLNQYQYEGEALLAEFHTTYFEQADIEALSLDGYCLTIKGFHERYEAWIKEKQAAFQQKIMEIEEQKKARSERKEKERMQWLERRERIERQERIEYQERLESQEKLDQQERQEWQERQRRQEVRHTDSELSVNDIRKLVSQQSTRAVDSLGRRWVMCEICGCIDTDGKFSSYGGINHINLGICKVCNRK